MIHTFHTQNCNGQKFITNILSKINTLPAKHSIRAGKF